MKIIVQPEIAIELDEINISHINDSARDQRISAKVSGLQRSVLLWGPDEYNSHEAKNWTDETAFLKLLEKLSLKTVPFL